MHVRCVANIQTSIRPICSQENLLYIYAYSCYLNALHNFVCEAFAVCARALIQLSIIHLINNNNNYEFLFFFSTKFSPTMIHLNTCELNKRNEHISISHSSHFALWSCVMAFPLLLWLMHAPREKHQVAFFSIISSESSAGRHSNVQNMWIHPFVMKRVFSVSINRSIKSKTSLKRRRKYIYIYDFVNCLVCFARTLQTNEMHVNVASMTRPYSRRTPSTPNTFLMHEKSHEKFQFHHSNEKCKQREKRTKQKPNRETIEYVFFSCIFCVVWRENFVAALLWWLLFSSCWLTKKEKKNQMRFYCFHSWRCRHVQLNRRIAQKRIDNK